MKSNNNNHIRSLFRRERTTLAEELKDATLSYHSRLEVLTYAKLIDLPADRLIILQLNTDNARERLINVRGQYASTVDVKELIQGLKVAA